jgi:hypothetical protein
VPYQCIPRTPLRRFRIPPQHSVLIEVVVVPLGPVSNSAGHSGDVTAHTTPTEPIAAPDSTTANRLQLRHEKGKIQSAIRLFHRLSVSDVSQHLRLGPPSVPSLERVVSDLQHRLCRVISRSVSNVWSPAHTNRVVATLRHELQICSEPPPTCSPVMPFPLEGQRKEPQTILDICLKRKLMF